MTHGSAAEAWAQLKAFSDRIGPVYGTEDWPLFLYALVKMQAPLNVVELGTGLGATALWVAQAMKEIGAGRIWTIDSGQDWPEILGHSPELFTPEQRTLDFAGYMAGLLERFGLEEQLEFIERAMPPYPAMGQKLDLLFSDFRHGRTTSWRSWDIFCRRWQPAVRCSSIRRPPRFPRSRCWSCW